MPARIIVLLFVWGEGEFEHRRVVPKCSYSRISSARVDGAATPSTTLELDRGGTIRIKGIFSILKFCVFVLPHAGNRILGSSRPLRSFFGVTAAK